MDTSLDLPTLRVIIETLRNNRREFNASGQEAQQQIQQAQTQIQGLNVRIEQLRGAIAHVDTMEKQLQAEIEARTAAARIVAPTPVAPEDILHSGQS